MWSNEKEIAAQSTCTTWIITIRWWVHRVIGTIIVYVCVHAIFFVYTTHAHTIWLYNSRFYGFIETQDNAISTECQKQISFYRFGKILLESYANTHAYNWTQNVLGYTVIRLWGRLSHSVHMIQWAKKKFYGCLVPLTVLRYIEIHKYTQQTKEKNRDWEGGKGRVRLKGRTSELWMFRLHINSIEHTLTHIHMHIHARELSTMCILKMAAWHVYEIAAIIAAAAAVAANGSMLSMYLYIYNKNTNHITHNVHRLHDNRNSWTSFQSRTRRAVIILCTVDGLTVFFFIRSPNETWTQNTGKRQL